MNGGHEEGDGTQLAEIIGWKNLETPVTDWYGSVHELELIIEFPLMYKGKAKQITAPMWDRERNLVVVEVIYGSPKFLRWWK